MILFVFCCFFYFLFSNRCASKNRGIAPHRFFAAGATVPHRPVELLPMIYCTQHGVGAEGIVRGQERSSCTVVESCHLSTGSFVTTPRPSCGVLYCLVQSCRLSTGSFVTTPRLSRRHHCAWHHVTRHRLTCVGGDRDRQIRLWSQQRIAHKRLLLVFLSCGSFPFFLAAFRLPF